MIMRYIPFGDRDARRLGAPAKGFEVTDTIMNGTAGDLAGTGQMGIA